VDGADRWCVVSKPFVPSASWNQQRDKDSRQELGCTFGRSLTQIERKMMLPTTAAVQPGRVPLHARRLPASSRGSSSSTFRRRTMVVLSSVHMGASLFCYFYNRNPSLKFC
jgi:hypothetical protein